MMPDDRLDALLDRARDVMASACCEFSGFPVGAALLARDGSVHVGVNVESSSFGGTICAERSALVAALSLGVRGFEAIAIATNGEHPVMPCGLCRQLLHDYAPELVIVARAGPISMTRTIRELLPDAFDRDDLR